MQFSTKEDVEAPIDYVFRQVTDFEKFERSALRRGADVQREAGFDHPDVGVCWKGSAEFRGKTRKFTGEIVRLDPPSDLGISAETEGFDIELEIELVPLSPKRTRMRVTTQLKARNLTARLILQSAKLARNNLIRRYKKHVRDFSKELDRRYVKDALS